MGDTFTTKGLVKIKQVWTQQWLCGQCQPWYLQVLTTSFVFAQKHLAHKEISANFRIMPSLDVGGIWREWDNDEEGREVFRAGENILEPPACADISTSVKHGYLLRPILTRMALKENRPLPPVEQLREELEELFQHNKQGLELDFLEVGKKVGPWRSLPVLLKPKLGEGRYLPPLGCKIWERYEWETSLAIQRFTHEWCHWCGLLFWNLHGV